jgi:FtsH-binding integral membrane protein
MQYETGQHGYPIEREGFAGARLAFIRRTYAHLAGAILALVGIEALLLTMVDFGEVFRFMAMHPMMWLLVLVAFIGGGFVARIFAQSRTSPGLQYVGLGCTWPWRR